MRKHKIVIDPHKFGPWAIITGASSGIGAEFADQLAANGIHLILIARRKDRLQQLGQDLADKYKIQYRSIDADLSQASAVEEIIQATKNLEVSLLVSNAGTGKVSKFFTRTETEHLYITQLNAVSHLSLVHYFGGLMAARNRGGVILTGAMGAGDGIPYMGTEAGTKGFIHSLGKSLHSEFKDLGLHLTTLITPPTQTPVLEKLGFTPQNTPIKPISVYQCVRETLIALQRNKMTVMPGLKFRLLMALTPASFSRAITGRIMKKNNKL